MLKLLQTERLKSDVKEENHDQCHLLVRKKRQRESRVDFGSTTIKKYKAIEDLQEMNVHQLREKAILRGISSNGLKVELIHRISVTKEPKDLEGSFSH